jgi:hypothetical protein
MHRTCFTTVLGNQVTATLRQVNQTLTVAVIAGFPLDTTDPAGVLGAA